jgi:hypothetical protein
MEVLSPDGATAARLFTVEKPWIPNASGGLSGEPFRSCVSTGTYSIAPFVRPNGDRVWRLSNPDLDVFPLDTDIPKSRIGLARFLILIHTGNYARDVVGCMAPGLNWRTNADSSLMVTSSKLAMQKLHALLDGRRQLAIEISQGAT